MSTISAQIILNCCKVAPQNRESPVSIDVSTISISRRSPPGFCLWKHCNFKLVLLSSMGKQIPEVSRQMLSELCCRHCSLLAKPIRQHGDYLRRLGASFSAKGSPFFARGFCKSVALCSSTAFGSVPETLLFRSFRAPCAAYSLHHDIFGTSPAG